MIKKILSQKCFESKPPVLVDVGASGGVRKAWRSLSGFSVCIAFDPDDRDAVVSKDSDARFKEFYWINRAISDKEGEVEFYLTKSPHCSSLLKPDIESLKKYHLCDAFLTEKKVLLQSITLKSALKMVGYDYIDWLKTDTQGCDLRVLMSLDERVIDNILVVEFEPGIQDAYVGEDKLYKIMEFFDNRSFWCDECIVKGLIRVNRKIIDEEFNMLMRRFINLFQKNCAFWAEISYMNEMSSSAFQERDFLLMCAFALVKEQYGFAMEISSIAEGRYDNPIFSDVYKYSLKRMKMKGYAKLPGYVLKKIMCMCRFAC